MRHLALLSLITLTGVSACDVVPKGTVTTLGSSPALSGGSYTSGGGLTVATEVRNSRGLTAVCGAWAQSRQQSVLTKHIETHLLQTGSVFLGNERVISGLAFMNEVAPADDYSGSDAVCVRTDRSWASGDESKPVVARIPGQVVVRDPGDEFAGGIIVYFRPTGPGAGEG